MVQQIFVQWVRIVCLSILHNSKQASLTLTAVGNWGWAPGNLGWLHCAAGAPGGVESLGLLQGCWGGPGWVCPAKPGYWLLGLQPAMRGDAWRVTAWDKWGKKLYVSGEVRGEKEDKCVDDKHEICIVYLLSCTYLAVIYRMWAITTLLFSIFLLSFIIKALDTHSTHHLFGQSIPSVYVRMKGLRSDPFKASE